jgi:lon-related putative ATP-dependent protease
LGLGIKDFRYNIYVAGSAGTGKDSTVSAFLREVSAKEPAPPDLCYVYNFEKPYRPQVLELPPGMGKRLQVDMRKLIERLKRDIPAALESEDYQKRHRSIESEFEVIRNRLFEELSKRAEAQGFVIKQTDQGLAGVPLIGGEPLSEEKLHAMSMEELQAIDKKVDDAQPNLQKMFREAFVRTQQLEERRDDRMKSLEQRITKLVLLPLIEDLCEKYCDHKNALKYILAVKDDILGHLTDFLPTPEEKSEGENSANPAADGFGFHGELSDPMTRYDVNVVVDHSNTNGAPVVTVNNATYSNLFGRVERHMHYGVMISDFTMIRSGALHEARGGFLVLSAENLFKNWMSWEALKSALRCGSIEMEDPGFMQIYPTVSEGVRPEPAPMDVKVIMVGSEELYLTLQTFDEEFRKLFNVKSDFDDVMEWKNEYIHQFGPFIRARIDERSGLKHFDRTGVARVVEYASELTEDQDKLSAQFSELMTVIREASYWASLAKSKYVTAKHVDKAVEEKIYRHNLVEEKIQELISKGDILVDVKGKVVGQVNGLYVVGWGDFSFGRPARITAAVYAGKDGVMSIEREAELSGTTHTKGLLILKGWLGERFAKKRPLSLTASITFEQSYSMVDGDSASSTELYGLISTLADLPIRQGIAVTGSVNQKGEIQPIGGVNEKIEGFFEVCKAKGGLTGDQGVMIPHQNVRNLSLNEEVVNAVKKGKFNIWAIKSVEEGIELLTGHKAGKMGKSGRYSKGSVYALVDERLQELEDSLKQSSEGGH